MLAGRALRQSSREEWPQGARSARAFPTIASCNCPPAKLAPSNGRSRGWTRIGLSLKPSGTLMTQRETGRSRARLRGNMWRPVSEPLAASRGAGCNELRIERHRQPASSRLSCDNLKNGGIPAAVRPSCFPGRYAVPSSCRAPLSARRRPAQTGRAKARISVRHTENSALDCPAESRSCRFVAGCRSIDIAQQVDTAARHERCAVRIKMTGLVALL